MTSSDLLFVLLIVSTLAVIPISMVAFARHQRRRAAGWLGIAAGVWVGYVAAGFAVAVSTPQRVLARNEERCLDEICSALLFWRSRGTPGLRPLQPAAAREAVRRASGAQRLS